MSRNGFWERYKGRPSQLLANVVSLSLVTVPYAFAKLTRPRFPLVSNVANGRLSHFLRGSSRGRACFTEKALTVSDRGFLSRVVCCIQTLYILGQMLPAVFGKQKSHSRRSIPSFSFWSQDKRKPSIQGSAFSKSKNIRPTSSLSRTLFLFLSM